MWTPNPPIPLSGIAFFVAILSAILAIFAVIASIRGHGIALIVLFFISFPIGYFLLWVPGWMWVIGVLNVGYLIAGLIAWRMPNVIKGSESSAT
jgi:hypothetical protein